jgi:hypothetical protein
MQAPSFIPLPESVSPGSTTELAIDLRAPLTGGDYRGYWMLQDASGDPFGIGGQADRPFWVDIQVVPESSPYSYDFSENMCEASWRNSSRFLRCPSNTDSPFGSIFYLNTPYLEDGRRENEQTLWTRPETRPDGLILGEYPPYLVNNKDHFMADIGCLHGNTDCDVVFYLGYRVTGQPIQTLGSWHERYDGETTRVVLDLSDLAGQTVQFILSVTNQGVPSQANAFWLVPSIRQVAPTPVPTATNTSPPTPTPTQTLDWTNIPAVRLALQELIRRTEFDREDIRILSVNQVVWNDTCLEVDVPDQVCAPVLTPGYRIRFEVLRRPVEARTNEDGSVIYWIPNL